MKKKSIVIAASFILYIAFFSVGSIIAKDREFSDMENRNLQGFPKVSVKEIVSGKFMETFETYMSDQIILKDNLVKVSNTAKHGLNQKLLNSVYAAKDDMIIQNYEFDEKNVASNVDFVNEFADANQDLDISWFVAPTASYIYNDKLPKSNICEDEKLCLDYISENVSDNINFISCTDELLQHKDEYIYYKTDHHWTQTGAFYGYEALCKGLGIESKPVSCYNVNEPSKEFYGSLYSKAPTFNVEPDSIFLYENSEGKYNVEFLDDKFSLDSLYNYEKLLTKDKYTTYLDGNHALIRITSNAECSEPVLVIKDSYSHALLPFLADNYADIHVVDLRYYHKSVSEYCKQNGISKVIFINNADFVTTDKNFKWLY